MHKDAEEVVDIISTLKGFSRPLAANNALFPKRHQLYSRGHEPC